MAHPGSRTRVFSHNSHGCNSCIGELTRRPVKVTNKRLPRKPFVSPTWEVTLFGALPKNLSICPQHDQKNPKCIIISQTAFEHEGMNFTFPIQNSNALTTRVAIYVHTATQRHRLHRPCITAAVINHSSIQ